MAQDPEKRREYQRQYYQKKIKNDPEKMAQRNAAQKEYLKRSGYAASMKYNRKTYMRLQIDVRKEIAERYKAKCEANGIPYSKPLQDAIEKFLEND